ncbi:hypothetical protein Tco_1002992 [Tanacetum coccineum]|uniref:Uncharacterized protein n=1 Tax=Tanacetum coccineum TaxID=301880 RepID=A0ABQ5F8G4_9ASTR
MWPSCFARSGPQTYPVMIDHMSLSIMLHLHLILPANALWQDAIAQGPGLEDEAPQRSWPTYAAWGCLRCC